MVPFPNLAWFHLASWLMNRGTTKGYTSGRFGVLTELENLPLEFTKMMNL